MRPFVVGTRASPLALCQTDEVIARLRAHWPQRTFVRQEIVTQGDVVLDRPLPEFGGRGAFVKEMEVALQEGRVDLAVHSLKDMPVQLPRGLAMPAVLSRRDPRDALVLAERHRATGMTVATLPRGARVGTGSPRRAAFLRAFRPDLHILPVRGNLQTRLKKLETEGFDALILAAAGLDRLGLSSLIAERIDVSVCVPAPGQAALAVEARIDDVEVMECARAIDDTSVRAEITAERALLAALGGGCHVPVGALARCDGASLHLVGAVASVDGSRVVRSEVRGDAAAAAELGRQLADILRRRGALQLLQDESRS